jgi:hypothetical protein
MAMVLAAITADNSQPAGVARQFADRLFALPANRSIDAFWQWQSKKRRHPSESTAYWEITRRHHDDGVPVAFVDFHLDRIRVDAINGR